MQRLSVIIPTLNDREHLPAAFEAIEAGRGALNEHDTALEVVIADGGSYDDTVPRAEARGARIVTAEAEPAQRLQSGAEAARGDWLLFLSPDLRLPDDWAGRTAAFIGAGDARSRAGFFDWHPADATGPGAAIVTKVVRWANRRFAALRSDQPLLIHRSLFETIDGWPARSDWPFFDVGRRLTRQRLQPLGASAEAAADGCWRDGFLWRGIKTGWPLLLRLMGLRGWLARLLGGGPDPVTRALEAGRLRERAKGRRENKKKPFFNMALARGILRTTAVVLALMLLYRVVAAAPADATADTRSWEEIEAAAEGQTVYWNAWAGNPIVNRYIGWAIDTVEQRHGFSVRHVKLSDPAEAVTRVLAEKTAGRDSGGSVDLVWINGENFASMKENGLLYGPFAEAIPNHSLIGIDERPVLQYDFTVPVEGMEVPWGRAQFNFLYNSAYLPEPPRSLAALVDWAAEHPGRFTYPRPPDFMGSTFLKQVVIGLAKDPAPLYEPLVMADFDAVTAPLWAYLDRLHPHLWRDGERFPASGPRLQQLLGDGEVAMALAFNGAAAANLIAQRVVPDSVRPLVLDGGTIGNAHYLAIPYNAKAKEAAMVLIDFLLSPEAQARKMDPQHWGDLTVLSMNRLSAAQRAVFEALPRPETVLGPKDIGTPLAEPHPSWMVAIERKWQRRYGR